MAILTDQQWRNGVEQGWSVPSPAAVEPLGLELRDLDAEYRAARQLCRAGVQLGEGEAAGHLVLNGHQSRLEHVAVEMHIDLAIPTTFPRVGRQAGPGLSTAGRRCR